MSASAPEGADEFVRIGALRLRVRRAGDGAPLLLINGIGAPLEMFGPLTKRLEDRELITFDLPGSGLSPAPRRPLGMRRLATIVEELVGRLGRDRVDVLGHSFGGAVAQELALRAPSTVDRLVLCATTPGLPAVPPSPLVMAMMLTPARYYSDRVGAYIVPRVAGGRTAREPLVLAAGLLERQRHPPSPLGYACQLAAITGWTSQPWLHRLRQPTLIIHGTDDPVAPLVNARWMARRINGARLHVLPDTGHLFLLDDLDAAVPVIRDFLTR